MSRPGKAPGGQPPTPDQPPSIISVGIQPSRLTNEAVQALRTANLIPVDYFPNHEALSNVLLKVTDDLKKATDIPKMSPIICHVATILRHLGHQKINAQAVDEAIKAVATRVTAELNTVAEGIRTNAEVLKATANNYTQITHEAVEINKSLSDTCAKFSQIPTPVPSTVPKPTYSQIVSSPAKPQGSLTQRIQNKQGIQYRQFLITFEPDTTDGPRNMSAEENARWREKFNNALQKATEGTDNKTEARAVTVLNNGRVLVEIKDTAGARWLREGENRETIAKLFHPGCFFHDRPYPLIIRFVPLSVDLSDETLRDLEAAHDLPPESLREAAWIKDPKRRSPRQEVANIKVVCSTPEAANKLLTSVVRLGDRIVNVQKETKEPARCNKCQHFGHFAAECKEVKDTCGNCGKEHRTSSCDQETWWCTSCSVDSHPSTSRRCPQFTRRLKIMHQRNPEYSLPFYQTDEEWTWELSQGPNPPPRQPAFLPSSAPNPQARAEAQRSGPRLVQSKLSSRYFNPNPNWAPMGQRQANETSCYDTRRA